jgi:NAD(P)-dependent dehydrogenase (short-subunit alcohol dehydrogenase family)
LVNCAGIAFAKPITELALADWHRVMTTNLNGLFLGTKHALRAMSGRGRLHRERRFGGGDQAPVRQRGLRHKRSRHTVLHPGSSA